MFDILRANEIYRNKLKEDPNFAEHLIQHWQERMPEEFATRLYEEEYGCHIVDAAMYNQALM